MRVTALVSSIEESELTSIAKSEDDHVGPSTISFARSLARAARACHSNDPYFPHSSGSGAGRATRSQPASARSGARGPFQARRPAGEEICGRTKGQSARQEKGLREAFRTYASRRRQKRKHEACRTCGAEGWRADACRSRRSRNER